ncbi:MAG: response regulator [Verrucomicrobiales bacterium]|nr:response regulator [Verrucomicrobiales bacterium]
MKKTALLVTESIQTLESLGAPLQLANYEVLLARNAREASNQFSAAHIDLTLVDLDWPTANGWDALKLLHEVIGGRPYLPVILITSRSGLGDEAQAYGARALAEKPLDVPALLATAEELLAESQAEGQSRACNQRADFRHPLPELPEFRELIRRRATPPYVNPPPTSRWGLNE